MHALVEQLVALDRAVMDAAAELRWSPVTGLFVLASAWWVKGPLFVLAGLGRDLYNRMLPLTAFVVLLAFASGDAASGAIKQAVDRPRPPVDDPGRLDAVVAVPGSPSFPSGHAMSAFAVAGVIALLAPRLRWPVLVLAALIGFSRVYLGVHFWLDVLAGAALGMTIAALVTVAVRRALAIRPG